jgi:hypothetical protein
MSDFPGVIQIGAYRINVFRDSEYMKNLSEELGAELSGVAELGKQRITLDEDQPQDYEADTLLHEILHMCFNVSAMDIDTEVKTGQTEQVEERVIGGLTNILLDTLRRNPELVEYLMR